MEEKEGIKISLSTLFLIIALIVIIIMGMYIYKLSNTVKDLENKQKQEEISKQEEIVIENNKENEEEIIKEDKVNDKDKIENNVEYTFNANETNVEIVAMKNGKKYNKNFVSDATIDKTETLEIPKIGTVAAVSESGGEYCSIILFQLIDGRIKEIGRINCGADMINDAEYTVEKKNDNCVRINSKSENYNLKYESKTSNTIVEAKIVNFFDYGKCVLVVEDAGSYYEVKIYRGSQDYTTGRNKKIIKSGNFKYNK